MGIYFERSLQGRSWVFFYLLLNEEDRETIAKVVKMVSFFPNFLLEEDNVSLKA